MSTTLIRLDSPDATIGGFRITFPSGCTKNVHWRSEVPILPLLDAAKQYAASTIQALLNEGRQDDIDRTNWVSVTAAIKHILTEFNATTIRRIHTTAGH